MAWLLSWETWWDTSTRAGIAGAARPVPFDQRRSNEKRVKLKRNQFTAGKVQKVEELCVSEVRSGSDPDKSSLSAKKRIFTSPRFLLPCWKESEIETAITSAVTARKHSSALMTWNIKKKKTVSAWPLFLMREGQSGCCTDSFLL